jgi:glycoprotease/Kae1 family metallohydrolase
MLCLGIESTAHTLGIGIFRDRKPLSNAKRVYKPINEGIVPRKAADYHSAEFAPLLSESLSFAGVKLSDIDLFAFSQGPGIGQCLRTSCAAAKYLALKHNKPIIGVNHCAAHVEISKLCAGFTDPLVLYVSGGNTQIIIEEPAGKGRKRYHVLGETLDIGVGNLFDNLGRAMGLEYAHGSVLEEMAKKGKYVELPYTVKGMNLLFTGLQTAAEKKLATAGKEDVTYSVMETSFAMLTEATERALCLSKKKEVLVCGGVACNKKLQGMFASMAEEQGARFGVAPNEFNADNGAMIAYTGIEHHSRGKRMNISECRPLPNQRIDSFNF